MVMISSWLPGRFVRNNICNHDTRKCVEAQGVRLIRSSLRGFHISRLWCGSSHLDRLDRPMDFDYWVLFDFCGPIVIAI